MSLENYPEKSANLPSQPEQLINETFRSESLDHLAVQLRSAPRPDDHPCFHDRLHMTDFGTTIGERLQIPVGPWETNPALPNMVDHIHIQGSGITTDQFGRPVHPWLTAMIERPDVGIVTGKASYYYWGPNFTVDPIIVHQDKVLLVKRADGAWALPGGYLDPGESSKVAGPREVHEEANVTLNTPSTTIYVGPVADVRMTANAWPETYAELFEVDDPNIFVDMKPDGKETTDVGLFSFDEIKQMQLFGSHNLLITQAEAYRTSETAFPQAAAQSAR